MLLRDIVPHVQRVHSTNDPFSALLQIAHDEYYDSGLRAFCRLSFDSKLHAFNTCWLLLQRMPYDQVLEASSCVSY